MTLWTLAGLLLLAAPAAQADTTAPPPPVALEGEWRFRTGDDPRWADPALDDHGWMPVAVPGVWEDAVPGYDGFGWYRREVVLPPALAEGPLGVRFGTVGDAFEVYWNGVLIGRRGSFPPRFVEGVDPALVLVPGRALAARPDGRHVVAVRVYNAYAYGGLMGGARVGRYDVLIDRSPRDTVIGALLAFFLAIGIYHLTFYVRRREARENLHFAVLCALVSLHGATYSSAFAALVTPYVNPYRVGLLALLVAGPFFLVLVHRLFELPLGQWARRVSLVFAAAFVASAALPLGVLAEFNVWVDAALAAGLVAMAARAALSSPLRGGHARVLAVGTAAFSAAVVWDLASEYHLLPLARVLPGVPGLFWLGFLAFIVTVGIATAGKWARAEVDALTDTLTGLSRRHVFEEALRRETGRMRRSGGRIALVVMDLDHFKRINDTWGHRMGDEVLARVGRLLRHSARNIDLTARLGGEEFGVLLFDTGMEGALAFVERFRGHLRELEVAAPGGPVRVTASVGIAVAEEVADPDDLLDAADRAAYRAKSEGRDRLVTVTVPPAAAQPA